MTVWWKRQTKHEQVTDPGYLFKLKIERIVSVKLPLTRNEEHNTAKDVRTKGVQATLSVELLLPY